MSRAKALADAEADRAEAEEAELDDDGGEHDDGGEGGDDAGDPDGLSVEAQLAAFERENVRHAEALSDVMGADFEAFEPCEHCGAVGFRPSQPFKRDPALTMCEACDGHGMLVTGSLNPQFAVRPCMTCGGNGFVTRPVAPPPLPPQQAYGYPPPPPGYEPPRPYDLPTPPVPDGSGWAPGYTPPAGPRPGGS